MFSSNVHGSYFTCQRLAFLAATKRKKGKKLIKTQYCMSRTFIAIESDAISFVVWWRAWVREYLFRIRYTSKKKNIKISLDFFKPKKPALAYYCTIQYRAYKRWNDDDAARFILFVIILRVNFILIFYHSFIFIDFFPLHSSMKTSTATTKTATLPIFLLLLAKKYKEQVEKEEWEAFKL